MARAELRADRRHRLDGQVDHGVTVLRGDRDGVRLRACVRRELADVEADEHAGRCENSGNAEQLPPVARIRADVYRTAIRVPRK